MTCRPLVLDLFCGAGGVAMGYTHAGFDVVRRSDPARLHVICRVASARLLVDVGGVCRFAASSARRPMRSRRQRPRPPKRRCRECGTDVYAWAEAPLCPSCVRAVTAIDPGRESLRAFRQRVIDPERNAS